jgi:acetyl esterase
VHRIADVQLRGLGGRIAARAYWPVPDGTVTAPALLVLVHGHDPGGGDLDTADALCRSACADMGVVVLSVDYRSATADPRALQDSTAAVHWAADHAAELGADPAQLLLAGTGICAGLAAAVARRARDDGWPAIKLHVSIRQGTARRMGQALARSLRPVLEAG